MLLCQKVGLYLIYKRASTPNANPIAELLWPNDDFAEYDETQGIDFLSNGFKVRESATGFNGSGNQIHLHGICRKSSSRNEQRSGDG